MENISYWEAWSRWLDGQSVVDCKMLGLQILWWGRLGIILVFTSALAIIAEIIGPERFRKFGQGLRSYDRRFGLVNQVAGLHVELNFLGIDFLHRGIQHLALVIAVGSGVAVGLVLQQIAIWVRVLLGLVTVPVVMYLGLLIAVFAKLAPAHFSMALDRWVIQPIAWLLEQKTIDKIIKLGSLALVVIGFHFQLLAS